jgi:hypothetical protein
MGTLHFYDFTFMEDILELSVREMLILIEFPSPSTHSETIITNGFNYSESLASAPSNNNKKNG